MMLDGTNTTHIYITREMGAAFHDTYMQHQTKMS